MVEKAPIWTKNPPTVGGRLRRRTGQRRYRGRALAREPEATRGVTAGLRGL